MSPVPPTRLRRSAIALLALANAGGMVAYLPLLSLLLPMKLDAAVGVAKLDVLSACLALGALAASGSNIVFGALSDRTVARGGGRRGWVAGGMVATLASYAGIAAARDGAQLVASVMLFQVAVNAMLGPLTAIVADEVPDAQKGLFGGLLTLGPPLAGALGVLLVGSTVLGADARLMAVPLVSAACIAPLLLTRRQRVPAPVHAPVRPALRRDLAILWAARLLVMIANNVLATYLLFYFESLAPFTYGGDVAQAVGALLAVASIVPIPLAIVAGRFSDVTGRRVPVLVAAAALGAAGLVGMAAARDWTAGAIAYGVYTLGGSTFLALHATYAMQLLPNPRHRGRDLGLVNLTNTLPALAGPGLTWALATPRDFAPALLLLAALALAGGATMLAVKSGGRAGGRPPGQAGG